jgi:hypothetical protein
MVQRRADWPTRCIFCGGVPITPEHVYSRKWIRKLFPGIGLNVAAHGDPPEPGHRLGGIPTVI